MFKLFAQKAPAQDSQSERAGVEFCMALVSHAQEQFGSMRVKDLLKAAFSVRDHISRFGLDGLPVFKQENPEALKLTNIVITNELTKAFGTKYVDSLLENIVRHLELRYLPHTVNKYVMPILPVGLLEHRKLQALSKEELEREVEKKTQELREINQMLEEKVAERTVALRQLLGDQEKAAQLLVRRDFELTKANDRLRKLDDIKSNFISVVAHQLRTPLSGIKWTLNLLLNGDLGEMTTEQKTFLLKAYESNDRMISLVNDMLGADRIESGKMRYEFQPIQLLDVADNVLFELLPQVNAKELTIKFENREKDLPKVHADPERIRAVFQNLLENAVKYSRQGGTIGIRMESTDHSIAVQINDDGIGIPKEQQKNIFDRFFRAKNAVKMETDGSGLGLFIVKSIIERHGGKIWFESEENNGVTFHFTLPVARAEDPPSVQGMSPANVDGL